MKKKYLAIGSVAFLLFYLLKTDKKTAVSTPTAVNSLDDVGTMMKDIAWDVLKDINSKKPSINETNAEKSKILEDKMKKPAEKINKGISTTAGALTKISTGLVSTGNIFAHKKPTNAITTDKMVSRDEAIINALKEVRDEIKAVKSNKAETSNKAEVISNSGEQTADNFIITDNDKLPSTISFLIDRYNEQFSDAVITDEVREILKTYGDVKPKLVALLDYSLRNMQDENGDVDLFLKWVDSRIRQFENILEEKRENGDVDDSYDGVYSYYLDVKKFLKDYRRKGNSFENWVRNEKRLGGNEEEEADSSQPTADSGQPISDSIIPREKNPYEGWIENERRRSEERSGNTEEVLTADDSLFPMPYDGINQASAMITEKFHKVANMPFSFDGELDGHMMFSIYDELQGKLYAEFRGFDGVFHWEDYNLLLNRVKEYQQEYSGYANETNNDNLAKLYQDFVKHLAKIEALLEDREYVEIPTTQSESHKAEISNKAEVISNSSSSGQPTPSAGGGSSMGGGILRNRNGLDSSLQNFNEELR